MITRNGVWGLIDLGYCLQDLGKESLARYTQGSHDGYQQNVFLISMLCSWVEKPGHCWLWGQPFRLMSDAIYTEAMPITAWNSY